MTYDFDPHQYRPDAEVLWDEDGESAPAEEPIFYHYLWSHRGVPKYAGKGKNGRYKEHLTEKFSKGCNRAKVRYFQKHGHEMTCWVSPFEFESEAYAGEVALITKHGRLDLGTGPLLNLSAGGDGVEFNAAVRAKIAAAARNPSPETRAKIAAAARNRSPETRARSPETRAKMAAAARNRSPASEETRAKIAAAARNRRAKVRAAKLAAE